LEIAIPFAVVPLPLAIVPVIVVLPVPAIVSVRALAVSVLMSTSDKVSVPPFVMLFVNVRFWVDSPVSLPLKLRLWLPMIVDAVSEIALESERAALSACRVPELSVRRPLAGGRCLHC